jgi:hypothetical protein
MTIGHAKRNRRLTQPSKEGNDAQGEEKIRNPESKLVIRVFRRI